jgi:predicted nucleic acid-binding protein
MIVVSNTSPIIGLAAVGQLDLLCALWGQVLIPQAVRDEVEEGANRPGGSSLATRPWIETRHVQNWLSVSTLQLELGAGESEAIALAAETGSDLLLLDEHKGRTIAIRLGLKVVGSLGVLILAKHRGLLPAVRPVMDDLIHESGFRVSRAVFERALRLAGE